MFKKWWTYMLYGNRYAGIEHCAYDGRQQFYATLLKSKKKELEIEKTLETSDVDKLIDKLPKQQHYSLSINTNKVLSKQIQSDQTEALKLVYKAFPNIQLEDFYYDVLASTSNQNYFVSICRKTDVDEMIKYYAKQKIYITQFNLGHHSLSHSLPFINETQIYSSNAVVSIEDHQILSIESSPISFVRYDINGLLISNEHLLSSSGALGSVLKQQHNLSNYAEHTNTLNTSFVQKRLFNLGVKFGGLFILLLLLINFFVFNYYFNEVKELEQVSEINQATKAKILDLKTKVSKKETMVEDLLKSEGSRSSFYADRIINTMPSSIILSELNYQPLLKHIKANQVIELDLNQIQVSGTSNDSEVFSEWINMLERKNWVQNIDIIDFGTGNGSQSEFKINILLND